MILSLVIIAIFVNYAIGCAVVLAYATHLGEEVVEWVESMPRTPLQLLWFTVMSLWPLFLFFVWYSRRD